MFLFGYEELQFYIYDPQALVPWEANVNKSRGLKGKVYGRFCSTELDLFFAVLL